MGRGEGGEKGTAASKSVGAAFGVCVGCSSVFACAAVCSLLAWSLGRHLSGSSALLLLHQQLFTTTNIPVAYIVLLFTFCQQVHVQRKTFDI